MASPVIQAAVKTVLDRASLRKVEGDIDGSTKRIGSRLDGIRGAAKGVALGIAGIGVAGVAVGVKLVGDFLSTADAIGKMATRTGIGVEELQRLDFVLQQNGSSIEVFEKGILTAAKGLEDARTKGTGPFADGIKELNIDLADLEGLSPDELFKVLAEEISKVPDPLKQAAIAQKVFGGAGKELLPTLKSGAEGIAALSAEADKNANIMSEDAVRGAEQFNDAINSAKQFVLGFLTGGIAKLIPELVKLGKLITETVVPAFREHLQPIIQAFVKDYLPTLQKVFGVVFKIIYEVVKLAVGFVINDLKFLLTTIKGVIDLVSALIRGDWTAAWQALRDIVNGALNFLRTKVELVINFVRGIFNAFGIDINNVFVRMGNAGARFVNRIVGFFTQSIPNKIKGGINAIIRSFQFIPDSFTSALNSVIRAWNNFSVRTPAVTVFGKTVVPAITFNTPNVPTFKNVRLPRLQQGGIAVSDTVARIGDGGEPEAVVPLSRAAEFGFGGGGAQTVINLNMNFEGATDADETALTTVKELQRAFRLGNTQLVGNVF